ncbi:MAG: hypothetical protein ACPGQS_06435, partial [Bradymonadia bacterium]
PKEKQHLVEAWEGQVTLDTFFDEQAGPLLEISAVYLTLQIASILKLVSDEGIPIAPLSDTHFAVDTQIPDLPKVTFLGVLPTRDTDTPHSESEMFPFVSRVLYRCLTGTLPPSEQASTLLDESGEISLGFDDLLMNWSTEDTALGALGTSAMNAINNTDESHALAQLIESLYPHLKNATQQRVEQESQILAQDRHLLDAVRTHRGKLKELRTRQQYLTGWLMDQEPEIGLHKERLEARKDRAKSYATLLEQLRQHLFSRSSSTSTETNDSLRGPARAHRSTPLEFSALSTPELNVDQQAEDNIDGTIQRGDAIPEEPEEALPPISRSNSARPKSMVSLLITVIVGATVLGVLFAWSLLSGGSADPAAPHSSPAPIDSE